MENSGFNPPGNQEQDWEQWPHKQNRAGRILGGLVLVIAGGVFLARQLGAALPSCLFTWQMLLIVIGLYIGARHTFKGAGWLIPIFIGAFFMIDHLVAGISFRRYFWPVLIIGAGVFMMFRPRRRFRGKAWRKWQAQRQQCRQQWQYQGTETGADHDRIDSVAVFGGIKKNIISKNFKGGEIICVFGGSEINFSQCDFEGVIELEVVQFFGGLKLILPPHWKLQTEMVAVLAGVDDKRPVQPTGNDADKILILKGTTFCGGIQILSY